MLPLHQSPEERSILAAMAVGAVRARWEHVFVISPADDYSRLGLRWTQSNHRNISISHRMSVGLLDENVGPNC
jgi:hypothetical protein